MPTVLVLCEGVDDTEFSSQVVVTGPLQPLQVYICMCRLSIYTEVIRDLSGCTITNVSKKGMDPSSLDVSVLNCICESKLLRCCRNSSLCDVFMSTKVSSVIFSTVWEDAQLC